MTIKPHHVLVKFGEGVPSDLQGTVLLGMERSLREAGLPCEVFLETMRDQNKLRRLITKDDIL